MTAIMKKRGVTLRRVGSVWLSLILLAGLLVAAGTAGAATLDSALSAAFSKLNSNLMARGVIVALLPETNEVAIEYDDEPVPTFGSELLVFAEASAQPETETEGEEVVEENAAVAESRPMIYHGSITVSEAAGHLNLANIDEGRGLIAEGDLVFLPRPVRLYLTPVRNLTPYPYFTSQATQSIRRLLKVFPGWEAYSLPASNQATVNTLKQQCRSQGRYGLVVMPFVVFQRNRFEVQLRITSLFSGLPLRALTEEFKPFVSLAPAAPSRQPLSPRPYPATAPRF